MIPKKIYIKNPALEQCDSYGVADARLSAVPYHPSQEGDTLEEYTNLAQAWHTDDEIPQSGGYILVIHHGGCEVRHTWRDLDLGDFDRELQWEQYCYYIDDDFKWCYIEDIIPQGKEARP